MKKKKYKGKNTTNFPTSPHLHKSLLNTLRGKQGRETMKGNYVGKQKDLKPVLFRLEWVHRGVNVELLSRPLENKGEVKLG